MQSTECYAVYRICCVFLHCYKIWCVLSKSLLCFFFRKRKIFCFFFIKCWKVWIPTSVSAALLVSKNAATEKDSSTQCHSGSELVRLHQYVYSHEFTCSTRFHQFYTSFWFRTGTTPPVHVFKRVYARVELVKLVQLC